MKHIHFVGIKGVAMTALAVWAKEKGYSVSGSDVSEEFPTDEVLKKANISVFTDFSAENVRGEMVIYTGAHGGKENIEVIEAQKRSIQCLSHGKALGQIMEEYQQISVAGCHGKTTSTAMIATILVHAGLDPSYAIGSGNIRGLGFPGHAGKGKWFIAEADEYVTDPGHDATPRFLWQKPEILLVTSIDYDHPDVYSNIDEIGNAYTLLADRSNYIIMNTGDVYSNKYLSTKRIGATYGNNNADIVIEQKEQKPFHNSGVFHMGNLDIAITLKVPGKHNFFNAAGAFLVAKKIGIDTEAIVDGLERFGGASRRFEYIGEKHGIVFIDDYAHHPTEITATLSALKEWYPQKKIIALFQPHTYSRTKALLHEFGKAFAECHEVGILPIYASAREKEQSIHAQEVVNEIQKNNVSVRFYPSLDAFFEKKLSKNDIILSLGAGDIGRKIRLWIQ